MAQHFVLLDVLRILFIGYIAEQIREIRSKEFYRNGKKDYTEELLHKIHTRLTQHTLNASRSHQHNIHNNHIQRQSRQNTERRILGSQRKESSKRPGTRQHRKDKRHISGLLDRTRILENLNIQHHFHCHKEEHQGTCYGKRVYIHTEKLQETLSHEEEKHHQQKRIKHSLESTDSPTLFPY